MTVDVINPREEKLVRFDWAMKKMLRSKANFVILEGFLSELLGRDIKIIQLLESESNQTHADDKQNRVDILVQMDGKEIVLVEVQVNTAQEYLHRMVYGAAKVVTDHMHKGDDYDKIKKVYSVNVLYFDLGSGEDYVYHGKTSFTGLHKKDKLKLSKMQKELYQIEHPHEIFPEYYLIKVNQFDDVAKCSLDEWIYFLKNEVIKDSFHAKGLSEAKDVLREMKLLPEERQEYEAYMEGLRCQSSTLNTTYKTGVIDGEKLGRAEGKLEGKLEAKLETAKNFKKLGVSVDVIMQATGLTAEEVGKL